MEIREVHEDELGRWVDAMRAALDEADTVEGYLDWKRQARETAWFLASEDSRDVGAAIGIGGWHSPDGVARGEIRVVTDVRGRGVGSGLLDALSDWARELGYAELMGPVKEVDADSLAWASRRGFVEVGRNSVLALDLTSIDAPEVVAPAGIVIATWAERPDAAPGMYEVAKEAYPDIPGEEDAEMEPFEQWLSMDMQGSGDRPEATFIAFADDEIIAYAKLSLSLARPTVAMHDITGVKRAWRGRGIAGALQGGRDRVGQAERVRTARDTERGAERADPPAQPAPRLRRRAGLGDRARASPPTTDRSMTMMRRLFFDYVIDDIEAQAEEIEEQLSEIEEEATDAVESAEDAARSPRHRRPRHVADGMRA